MHCMFSHTSALFTSRCVCLGLEQKYAADHTGRGEALERMPLEPNVTLVVSRSETAHLSLKALGERLTAIRRPDVNVLVLSPKVRRTPSHSQKTPKAVRPTRLHPSRRITTSQHCRTQVVKLARQLLLEYRTRLCRAGYGPFAGGSTPSSGLVTVRACVRDSAWGSRLRFPVLAPSGLGPLSLNFGLSAPESLSTSGARETCLTNK